MAAAGSTSDGYAQDALADYETARRNADAAAMNAAKADAAAEGYTIT
jgi:hypothetical protein